MAILSAYVTGHVYPRPLYYALYCVPDALNPLIVKRRKQPGYIADDDTADEDEACVQAKNQIYYDWLHGKMHE